MATAHQNLIRAGVELDLFGPKAVKDLKKAADTVQRDFSTSMVKAVDSGFSGPQMKKVKDKLMGISQRLSDTYIQMAATSARLAEKGITKEEKLRLESARKVAKAQIIQDEKRWQKEMDLQKKAISRRASTLAKVGKAGKGEEMAAGAEKFGESMGAAFSDVVSGDVKNLSGLIRRMGEGTKKMAAAAAKKDTGGPMGAMAGTLGKFLATVGPALIAIGAVVAGFAAIGKMVLDADDAAKDLNSTILESGIAAGELVDEYGEMGKTLDRVRESFSKAFNFNRIWGTTAKDHLEILGAYAGAGKVFRELTAQTKGFADQQERLREATSTTMVYAKLFGQENKTMAESMASWMEELGENFETLQTGLSAIHGAAMESGFGVKRFYGMVLQATSGMSMYNVRLSETAALLIKLGKILGARVGGDFLQQLTKGFTEETMQDRVKRVYLTTGKIVGDVIETEAGGMASAFERKLNTMKEGDKEAFLAAFDKAGIARPVEGKKGAAAFAKALAGLSKKEKRELLTDASLAGNDELVRELDKLITLSSGMKGGALNQAAALGQLGPGGKMAMQAFSAMKLFGKTLDELTPKQRMAVEGAVGVSGEAFDQLAMLTGRLRGYHEKLSEVQAEARKDTTKWAAEYDEKQAEEMAKTFGVYIDKEGNRRKAIFDKERDATGKLVDVLRQGKGEVISDEFMNLMVSQGDSFEELANQIPEDIKLAQEQVRETTKMSKIMEQGVERILADIHTVVTSIWQILSVELFGGPDQERIQKLDKDIKLLREKERGGSKELSKLEALRAGATGDEKEAYSRLIREKEVSLRDITAMLEIKRGQREGVLEGDEDAGYRKAYAAIEAKLGPEEFAKYKESMSRVIVEKYAKAPSGTHVPAHAYGQVEAVRRGGAVQSLTGDWEHYAAEDLKQAMLQTTEMASVAQAIAAAEKRAHDDVVAKEQKDRTADKRGRKEFFQEWEKLRKKELSKEQREQDEAAVAGLLMSLTGKSYRDMPQMQVQAKKFLQGDYLSTEEMLGEKGSEFYKKLGEKGIVSGVAHDIVMQIGSRGVKFAQRVDPGDVGVFAKPGGALAGAGAGGGATNIFHLYNDGPGSLRTIEKAQSAGVLPG